MQALLVDELTAADGCLRIGRSDTGTSYLPVWPPRFELSAGADEVVVYNRAGEVVGRVGQEIRVSGGEVHLAEFLDESIQRKLTGGDCAGPFWIVGDEAGVVRAAEVRSAPANALEGTPLAPSTQPSHGSPPPHAASPRPSLKFEGVEYVHAGYAEPADGAQAFVIDGTEVHVDNLEVVGRTTEGNTHGIQDGLQVYRHKGRETNEVYTFRQGEDHVNPEDGQVFKGRDEWTYWTAATGRSAPPSHGTPPPQAASPGPSLKFEGVEYVYTGYAEPADGAQAFFIDGKEVQVDNLEVVGRTTEGNTPGIQDGLQVYRHKSGGANEVYTFRQGKDHVNPEDGQIFKGRDGWTYWTVAKLTEPGQSG